MTFFLNGPAEMPKIKANAPAVDLPTWGEGFGAAADRSRLEGDSNFRLAHERQKVRSGVALDAARRIGGDVLAERMKEAGVPEYQAHVFPRMVDRGFELLPAQMRQVVMDEARKAAETNPEAWADLDMSEEAIEATINERLSAEHEDAQQILEMMSGGRGFAEFLGGMYGMTADIKNLPFLAFGGGGGSLVNVMGREALINMAAEGAFLPSQFEMAERLDIPDPSVATQLAMAAGAGAILGGGVTAAQRGLQYFRGRNAVKPIGRMDEIQSRALIDRTEDILTSDTSRPFEKINSLIEDAGDDIRPPPYRLENPINPERPPLMPPEVTTTPLPPVGAAPDAVTAPEATPTPKPKTPRPSSLKSFVVGEGGIFKGDDAGEIAGMEYRRPGFLKKDLRKYSSAGHNNGGLRVDEMRKRAVEQGFLPEGATINDFLDALDQDVRGATRVYRQADETAAGEWRAFDGEQRMDPDRPRDPVEEFQSGRPSNEPGQLFIPRKNIGFLEPDDIRIMFDDWVEERGIADTLMPEERQEVLKVLQENGGDAHNALSVLRQREINHWKAERRANDAPSGTQQPDDPATVAGSVRNGERPDATGGRARGDAADAGSDGAPLSERTDAGQQTLIDGVAPITTRDRLQRQQDAPMRGGNAAADDGLFDVGARSQRDMFSDPASPEAREIQETVASDIRTEIKKDGDFDLEIETPDGGIRVMSASELLDDLDKGDAFSARIDLCGKGPT